MLPSATPHLAYLLYYRLLLFHLAIIKHHSDLNITADGRNHNNARFSADERRDTLMHFMKGGVSKTWEIELANGTYLVQITAGDSRHQDQTNNLDVEGVVITDPTPAQFPNTGSGAYDEFRVIAQVTDGKLTVKPAPGASNAKITSIEIIPTPGSSTIEGGLYEYDALGRRVAKYTNEGRRSFIQSGAQVITEYNEVIGTGLSNTTSTPVATDAAQQYVYASYIDEPCVMIQVDADGPGDDRLHYYHRNQQYSVIALTTESGAVAELYKYTAHGDTTVLAPDGVTVWSATIAGNPYNYTGRRLDPETGLLYMRNRYHDAKLGRFISRDPAGYVDGWNLYRDYFSVDAMDPWGLEWNVQIPFVHFFNVHQYRVPMYPNAKKHKDGWPIYDPEVDTSSDGWNKIDWPNISILSVDKGCCCGLRVAYKPKLEWAAFRKRHAIMPNGGLFPDVNPDYEGTIREETSELIMQVGWLNELFKEWETAGYRDIAESEDEYDCEEMVEVVLFLRAWAVQFMSQKLSSHALFESKRGDREPGPYIQTHEYYNEIDLKHRKDVADRLNRVDIIRDNWDKKGTPATVIKEN